MDDGRRSQPSTIFFYLFEFLICCDIINCDANYQTNQRPEVVAIEFIEHYVDWNEMKYIDDFIRTENLPPSSKQQQLKKYAHATNCVL